MDFVRDDRLARFGEEMTRIVGATCLLHNRLLPPPGAVRTSLGSNDCGYEDPQISSAQDPCIFGVAPIGRRPTKPSIQISPVSNL